MEKAKNHYAYHGTNPYSRNGIGRQIEIKKKFSRNGILLTFLTSVLSFFYLLCLVAPDMIIHRCQCLAPFVVTLPNISSFFHC